MSLAQRTIRRPPVTGAASLAGPQGSRCREYACDRGRGYPSDRREKVLKLGMAAYFAPGASLQAIADSVASVKRRSAVREF